MRKPSNINDLIVFCRELKSKKIHFALRYGDDDAIIMDLVLPGERMEISFFQNDVLYCTFEGDEAFRDDLETMIQTLNVA